MPKASENISGPSDAIVISRVLLGDSGAFGVLFDRYAKRVFGYLWHFSRNRADCEDFLQDTFYKAYVNLKYCREREKFSSWLFSIAHNVAVSNSRKLGLVRSRELPEETLSLASEVAAIDDLSMEIVRQESRAVLKKVFDNMPVPYKQAIVLFYYNDFSLKEISATVNVPLNTVKTRLHRGREYLGKKLREEALREHVGFPAMHYPY